MGDVRNCKKCGKMFTYRDKNICEDCIKEELDDFKRVKDYLYDHPGASMTEVSMAVEISTRKLTRYLKEGRLEISGEEGANMLLSCESCGKSIRSGRWCKDCDSELKNNLAGISSSLKKDVEKDKDKDKEGGSKAIGMRYLNKKNG
jgi:flagellar operon protein (TIGR03826 family)